jgi:hypothetical protein
MEVGHIFPDLGCGAEIVSIASARAKTPSSRTLSRQSSALRNPFASVGALPPFKSGMLGNPIQCRIVFDLRTIAAGLNERKIPTVLGLR